MGLWIQLAFAHPPSVRYVNTSSGLKVGWSPAGGKDSFERIQWAVESDSWFFFLSCFLKVASGERRERRPSQLVPWSAPFLAFLPIFLLPRPFLLGFKASSPSQVGPQPHSQEGKCGIIVLPVNRLPKGARMGGWEAAGSGLLSASDKNLKLGSQECSRSSWISVTCSVY